MTMNVWVMAARLVLVSIYNNNHCLAFFKSNAKDIGFNLIWFHERKHKHTQRDRDCVGA